MGPLLDIGGFDEWVPLGQSRKPAALFAELGEERSEKLREEFARWLLLELQRAVRKCIHDQTFPVDYGPLSPAWAEAKARRHLDPGFWVATGTLVDRLTVWKERGERVWHLGWPKSAKHPDNDQPLATIAAALEFGAPERNLPARPLFTILSGRMRKQVYRLFYRFVGANYPRFASKLPRA